MHDTQQTSLNKTHGGRYARGISHMAKQLVCALSLSVTLTHNDHRVHARPKTNCITLTRFRLLPQPTKMLQAAYRYPPVANVCLTHPLCVLGAWLSSGRECAAAHSVSTTCYEVKHAPAMCLLAAWVAGVRRLSPWVQWCAIQAYLGVVNLGAAPESVSASILRCKQHLYDKLHHAGLKQLNCA